MARQGTVIRRTLIPSLLVLLLGFLSSAQAGAQGGGVHTDPLFELGDGVDPAVPGIGDILGSVQPGPDWDDLFQADRSPRDDFDEYGNPGSNGVPDFLDTFGSYKLRRDGVFVSDDISAGTAIDGTVLIGPGLVGPGTVDSGADIGNAYAYSAFNADLDFILYLGAERLTPADGSIVFEFNQRLFAIGDGGEILGERSVADLQIQVGFSAGILSSVEIHSWELVDPIAGIFDWLVVENLPIDPGEPAEQCNPARTVCAVCNGTSVDGGAWPNYDAAGDPIADLVPDTFIEVGINMSTLLLGFHNWDSYYDSRYASLQISSYDAGSNPRDHALGSFIRASRLARF